MTIQLLLVHLYFTFSTVEPFNSVVKDLRAADLTDLIVCLKNGHNLGTNSVSKPAVPNRSILTDGQDRIPDSSDIILLVEAVRSSSSTNVSHSVINSSFI